MPFGGFTRRRRPSGAMVKHGLPGLVAEVEEVGDLDHCSLPCPRRSASTSPTTITTINATLMNHPGACSALGRGSTQKTTRLATCSTSNTRNANATSERYCSSA